MWCQVSEAALHLIIINEWLVPSSLRCAASTIWYETTLTSSTKQIRNVIPPPCRVANLAVRGISLPGPSDGPATQAALVICWTEKAISAQIIFRGINKLAALTSAGSSWLTVDTAMMRLLIFTPAPHFTGCGESGGLLFVVVVVLCFKLIFRTHVGTICRPHKGLSVMSS